MDYGVDVAHYSHRGGNCSCLPVNVVMLLSIDSNLFVLVEHHFSSPVLPFLEAISVQACLCLCEAGVPFRVVVLICIPVRRHNMPRKEWSDAPMEWVQLVRGRRPKTEQWPLAPGHSQNRAGQGAQQRQTLSGGAPHRPIVRERKTDARAGPHRWMCHVCRQRRVLSGTGTWKRNVHWS